MNFNNLLRNIGLDPQKFLLLRHSSKYPNLKKLLPRLAAENHSLFNAYQSTQPQKKLENAMKKLMKNGFIASFIGHKPGKALFVGIYKINSETNLTNDQYINIKEYIDLTKLSNENFITNLNSGFISYFDLELTDHYSEWKGKLVIKWPPKEINWWRRAHNHEEKYSIYAIHEESILVDSIPKWNEIVFTMDEFRSIPTSWEIALSQWQGIYYIYDELEKKGYVGSASGEENIFGRWSYYSLTGHGGNKLLKNLNPKNFRFSILQIVAHDLDKKEVIRLENNWKERLHTRHPYGLNDN